jgi:hypothetical protein
LDIRGELLRKEGRRREEGKRKKDPEKKKRGNLLSCC